jgi:peptidoglycan hydrolase-like protein with peptidoglycan-binding domain
MKRSLFSAAALVTALAGAPIAFAQSGAQTGALGTGGSTPNQTGAATATKPNVGPGYSQGTPGTAGVPTNPGAPTTAESGNTNSNGLHQQLSQNEIQNVQQHLQQQGYYKNAKVDGRWGPHTQQAVESFQQAKGLPTTGQLDQQTLNALGVNLGG